MMTAKKNGEKPERMWYVKTTPGKYAIGLYISFLAALVYGITKYNVTNNYWFSILLQSILVFFVVYRITEYVQTKKILSPLNFLKKGRDAKKFFKNYLVLLMLLILLDMPFAIIKFKYNIPRTTESLDDIIETFNEIVFDLKNGFPQARARFWENVNWSVITISSFIGSISILILMMAFFYREALKF